MRIYLTLALIAAMLISCENKQTEPEKINFPSVISKYEALSKYSMQRISEQADLKNAEVALISYLKTNNAINGQNIEPAIQSGALAVFSDLTTVKDVLLNSESLALTSPLIYPGYYYSGIKWNPVQMGYGLSANWSFSLSDQLFEINTTNQDSIYQVKLNVTDTFRFDKNLQINWTKSAKSGNKVYISLKWYPSYSDENYYKDYPGFDSEDSGIYFADKAVLKSLNIPDYGILQVNVMRYNSVLQQKYGKNVFTTNLVESSSSVYIEKQ